MTKSGARELISSELIMCISESIDKLPSHIKIDSKGTKKYISFKDYGIYICFYVTSSLYYSVWRFGHKEEDKPAIVYDKNRDRAEIKAMVRSTFETVLNQLNAEQTSVQPWAVR